ncbi:MAG: hypothetical protein ACR2KV_14050 [Solirubrobacteraceae bacterium]
MVEPPASRRVSAEHFEAMLLEIRDGATLSLAEHALEGVTGGDQHGAVVEDLRAVWHAAEAALGVLLLRSYIPKREAVEDMRTIVRWLDEGPDGEDS